MGAENSNSENLQEIGKKANQQSPNSFINSSIIKLTNSTIIGDSKIDAEKTIKNYKY